MKTFQELIIALNQFWASQGCSIQQGYDVEVGAGTFNPITFLRSLGPEPYNAAYVEPSRRPSDGRYGNNPNRVQHYFQYQIILKPSPLDIQQKYLQSLNALGFNLSNHDIRFVHDDWESPTLGAWGLGWEIWIDGMEVSQFTYFQSVGGIALKPITGEITYGLERLAMYIQDVNTIYDIKWNETLTYGDIYYQNEVEWSTYNFEEANTAMWFRHFDDFEDEAHRLIETNLTLPAYDFVMKASHAFNILDARGVISVTERATYIRRIRELSCRIAQNYIHLRKAKGHPLLRGDVKTEEIVAPEEKEYSFNPKKTDDFLFEIGSEELPQTFIDIGCNNLKKAFEALFKEYDLGYREIKVYGSPRRIATLVTDLVQGKGKKLIERKGPATLTAFDKEGNLTKAGSGFFRSINKNPITLAELKTKTDKELEIRTIKSTDYLYAILQEPAIATATILSKHLAKLISQLDFPKKMQWSNIGLSYARPIHSIVALFGKETIPFSIANITASNISYGHPQLCPGQFKIDKAAHYLSDLKKHHVLVNVEDRLKIIRTQLTDIEDQIGGYAVRQDEVIEAVANLTEWPQLIPASFDPGYLQIPKEVLVSEMIEHQKYFPIADSDGNLTNFFVITADTKSTKQIKDGNCRALSPRLADGLFLYQQDLKIPLDQFLLKLKSITYQKGLGSLFDKTSRLIANVQILIKYLHTAKLEHAKRAAELAKADLASGLVFEFPELQGTIGKHYAIAGGEDFEVAKAIEEHRMPCSENGSLPQTESGILVALADKIDNLIACFINDLKPTSSSDPHALRRQVLGIIKILIAKECHLPLKKVLNECYDNFIQSVDPCPKHDKQEVLNDLNDFIIARIKTVFQFYDFNKDEIEASLSTGFSNIFDMFLKVKALHAFRISNKFSSLYEVFKRAKGQLHKQQKHDFLNDLLKEKAETVLHNQIESMKTSFITALEEREYVTAYDLLAELQPFLAAFFEEVKILDNNEQLKHNRLALLQNVFDLFEQLLDFSKIQEK